MNHTQTADAHGRIRDEYELAPRQLKTSNVRPSEVEVSACAVKNDGRRYREGRQSRGRTSRSSSLLAAERIEWKVRFCHANTIVQPLVL